LTVFHIILLVIFLFLLLFSLYFDDVCQTKLAALMHITYLHIVSDRIFALDDARAVSNTAAPDRSITKPQKPSSGKKYHQPISFSFADIMEKVRAFNSFCL